MPYKDPEMRRQSVLRWYRDNRERANELNREWRHRNPEKERSRHMESKYGLSTDGYDSLFKAQGGVCALCRQPPRDGRWGLLGVDHNHTTGKIRSLLCAGCNASVGMIESVLNRTFVN